MEKIRRSLKDDILSSSEILPKVATIQEFQGGEKAVIIISTVISYPDSFRGGPMRASSFLQSAKMFNVAITR